MSDSFQILLVEDSRSDVEFATVILREVGIPHQLHVVSDGEEALAFLRRQGEHVDAPRPDLVLLDLNLPRKSGLELLAEMKADPEPEDIAVIVLTTSEAERDIVETNRLDADGYVSKPLGPDQFTFAFFRAMRGRRGLSRWR